MRYEHKHPHFLKQIFQKKKCWIWLLSCLPQIRKHIGFLAVYISLHSSNDDNICLTWEIFSEHCYIRSPVKWSSSFSVWNLIQVILPDVQSFNIYIPFYALVFKEIITTIHVLFLYSFLILFSSWQWAAETSLYHSFPWYLQPDSYLPFSYIFKVIGNYEAETYRMFYKGLAISCQQNCYD